MSVTYAGTIYETINQAALRELPRVTRPRRPKPRPYYTQAEGERVRGQVLLRLLPEASARLTELADAQGVSRSALVEAWLLHGPGP